MVAVPDRKGVARNRSLPLDRVLAAHVAYGCSDDEDGASADGSRFGTPSTIHHLRRTRHRYRDDASEAGSQSASVSEGSAARAVRRSSGRVAVKRSSSRRVEHTSSFTGASELLQLLNPMKIEDPKSMDCDLEDENVAGIEPEKPDAPVATEEPRRRRLPARAKSSDAILDHRPRGQRRPVATRRNFVHTTGGSKFLKKDTPVSDDKHQETVEDAVAAPTNSDAADHQHHSENKETKLADDSSMPVEVPVKEEACRQRNGNGERSDTKSDGHESGGHHDRSSGDHHRHRELRGRPTESKSTAHSETSARNDLSSPKQDASKKSSSRLRSAASRSSSRRRHYTGRHVQRSRSDDLEGMRPMHAIRRKTSTQPRVRHNGVRSASPSRERDAEEYEYGPGSPGRDSKKATMRAASPSDAESPDESDSDDSSSREGYVNPYSKAPKGRLSDSDDDTVLQFDPTQHSGVQEVRRKYSQAYQFENADGTSVVGEITELADPVGEHQMWVAQQEHEKRKGALFDFLSGDGDDDGIEGDLGIQKGMKDDPNPRYTDSTVGRHRLGQSTARHADSERDRDRTTQRSKTRVKGHHGSRSSPSHDKGAAEPASLERNKKVHGTKSGSEQPRRVEEPLSPSQDHGARENKSQDKGPRGLGHVSPVPPSETPMSHSAAAAENEHSAGNVNRTVAEAKDESHDIGDNYARAGEADHPTEAGVDDTTAASTKAAARDPERGNTARKKGKGLGGIGRYFGRHRRPDEDDDIVSVGSTSVGFFNPVKARHQLLGDDSSCDSDLF